MTKFDIKVFTGKKRIERSIKSNPGIYKIWIWNEDRKEYTSPPRGNTYVAARKRLLQGKTLEERKTFETLDQARAWRSSAIEMPSNQIEPIKETTGPNFKDVLENYKTNFMITLEKSTQGTYKQLLDKHFDFFLEFKIHEITSAVIDQWIKSLKEKPQKTIRKAFKEELKVLSGIFKFYQDYDDTFVSPIKPRHRRDIVVKKNSTKKKDFMTEEQFFLFRDALSKGKDGELFSNLATIQFYQALRISEAAAISWEDVLWNIAEPSKTVLAVSKSLFFSRDRGVGPELKEGFKNATSNDGVKYLPLLPNSFIALQRIRRQNSSGLIFHKDKLPLTYRQITHRYNIALQEVGLSFSGTHFMRHGGGSYVYNKTQGDLSLVGMMLGNKDLKTAKIYAHRSPQALEEFAAKEWKDED